MSDADNSARYTISRFSAEFVDADVELAYRMARHEAVVREARIAFASIILVSLVLAVSEYLVLGPSEEFSALLIGRIVISLLCLLAIAGARRFWRSLMDGVIPGIVEAVGVFGFLTMTLMRPYEPGWHGLSMMLILFGLYIFVPNRFLHIVVLACTATLAFVVLLDAHFQLLMHELLIFCVILTVGNLLGARAAYRTSRGMREEYSATEQLRLTRETLAGAIEAAACLQAERDALAQSDALTGTVNRRHFLAMLERATLVSPGQDASAYPVNISLLVLEVDYFKQINDTYGHQHGEAVLKHLATVCQRVLRRGDVLARLRDSTFAALMYDAEGRVGQQMGERLRAELHHVPLRLPATALYISTSIGVAQWQAHESTESFLRRADGALASAQGHGGNRVELAATAAEAAVKPPLEGADVQAQNAPATLNPLPERP